MHRSVPHKDEEGSDTGAKLPLNALDGRAPHRHGVTPLCALQVDPLLKIVQDQANEPEAAAQIRSVYENSARAA